MSPGPSQCRCHMISPLGFVDNKYAVMTKTIAFRYFPVYHHHPFVLAIIPCGLIGATAASYNDIGLFYRFQHFMINNWPDRHDSR